MTESRELLDDLQASTPEVRLGLSRAGVQGVAKAIRLRWGGAEKLISADNHIDLTYCPPDLWSSQAPAKWKLLVPRTEELEDGLHWFVNAQDKGMWNGVGPGFLKYQKGTFHHVDEMKEAGFVWDYAGHFFHFKDAAIAYCDKHKLTLRERLERELSQDEVVIRAQEIRRL